MHKNLKFLGEFVGHLAMGAVMLAALVAFGAAAELLVQWVAPIVRDEEFVATMRGVGRIYRYADVVFAVWWVVFSTNKAIKEM